MENSQIQRSQGAKKICEYIVHISDDALFEIYLDWIQKESKIAKPTLNKWIKELRERAPTAPLNINYDFIANYVLPDEVKEPLVDFLPMIQEYGFFMANNKIFMEISHRSCAVKL